MMKKENSLIEENTLIGDVNEIRESARRVRGIVTPETFQEIDFHGQIRGTFEKWRKTVPLVHDVIGGRTSFYGEVRKYTGPKGQVYYPHFKKIDKDNLMQTETCVGNFYGGHPGDVFGSYVWDVLGNPLGLTIGTLGSAAAGSEIAHRITKKKLPRREFFKVFSLIAVPIGALGGVRISMARYELCREAEKNAMILDYLKGQLYPR